MPSAEGVTRRWWVCRVRAQRRMSKRAFQLVGLATSPWATPRYAENLVGIVGSLGCRRMSLKA